MGKRCERMGIVKTFYDWVEMEKTKIFFITKTRALYTESSNIAEMVENKQT